MERTRLSLVSVAASIHELEVAKTNALIVLANSLAEVLEMLDAEVKESTQNAPPGEERQ